MFLGRMCIKAAAKSTNIGRERSGCNCSRYACLEEHVESTGINASWFVTPVTPYKETTQADSQQFLLTRVLKSCVENSHSGRTVFERSQTADIQNRIKTV